MQKQNYKHYRPIPVFVIIKMTMHVRFEIPLTVEIINILENFVFRLRTKVIFTVKWYCEIRTNILKNFLDIMLFN